MLCSSWMNFFRSRSLARAHLAPQHGHEPLEAGGLELVEGADVGQLVRERLDVEERQRRQVLDHARVRFGQQCHVHRRPALGDVAVADLVGQDRLAAARQALDDVDAGAEQAAAQDLVETGYRTAKAFDRGDVVGE
jgi:hypothetical protein